MPDAFLFALAATLLVALAALVVDPAARSSPMKIVDAWGNGFWTLIPFTLQMSMIIIGGYVLAASPPVSRLIARLAARPTFPFYGGIFGIMTGLRLSDALASLFVRASAPALHNLGEAIANLLQPFWMLPVLALLGLRARDIMGYTDLVALVLLPVVIVLVTVFRPLA